MNSVELKKITLGLLDTFKKAGNLSIQLRNQGLKTKIKTDKTPVTNGDIEVNNILTQKISEITPTIPIVSEETTLNKDEKNLKNFWLIDPIDGTNDYVNDRDEFTINASLIINRKPAIGIINAPAKNRLFYSYGQTFSFEYISGKEVNLFNQTKKNTDEVVAVTYSDKLKPEILTLHKKFKVNKFQKMKSSYKFCVIAAGEYDLYVAEPRACEWDIAAGQAILEHAGGSVTDFEGNEILYGKPDFKNPSIILKNKSLL